MKHFTSSKFWQYYDALPANIQQLARENYELLKQNPAHPSLQFKSVKNGAFRSVRVSSGYRALGVPVDQVFSGSGLVVMPTTINYSANLK